MWQSSPRSPCIRSEVARRGACGGIQYADHRREESVPGGWAGRRRSLRSGHRPHANESVLRSGVRPRILLERPHHPLTIVPVHGIDRRSGAPGPIDWDGYSPGGSSYARGPAKRLCTDRHAPLRCNRCRPRPSPQPNTTEFDSEAPSRTRGVETPAPGPARAGPPGTGRRSPPTRGWLSSSCPVPP